MSRASVKTSNERASGKILSYTYIVSQQGNKKYSDAEPCRITVNSGIIKRNRNVMLQKVN